LTSTFAIVGSYLDVGHDTAAVKLNRLSNQLMNDADVRRAHALIRHGRPAEIERLRKTHGTISLPVNGPARRKARWERKLLVRGRALQGESYASELLAFGKKMAAASRGAVKQMIGPLTTERCADAFKISENQWRNWAKGKACPKGLMIRNAGRGRWFYRNDAQ
jgi:hypothetical protein